MQKLSYIHLTTQKSLRDVYEAKEELSIQEEELYNAATGKLTLRLSFFDSVIARAPLIGSTASAKLFPCWKSVHFQVVVHFEPSDKTASTSHSYSLTLLQSSSMPSTLEGGESLIKPKLLPLFKGCAYTVQNWFSLHKSSTALVELLCTWC